MEGSPQFNSKPKSSLREKLEKLAKIAAVGASLSGGAAIGDKLAETKATGWERVPLSTNIEDRRHEHDAEELTKKAAIESSLKAARESWEIKD